jgi:hypothetical protein
MTGPVFEGGCLCGKVRYRSQGDPKWVAFCHCLSCRRATGAPVTAYAGFAAARVAWTAGERKIFASSPGVRRGFCPDCGTPLSFEGERWPGEVHLHLGTLDQPERLPPTGHAYAEERLPWLRLEGAP